MAHWRAMFLSDCSLHRDSPKRASKDLDPKLFRITSACWFLLLCCGEGEAEVKGLGRFRGAWVGYSRMLLS